MKLVQGDTGIQIALLRNGARILYWKGQVAALMTHDYKWYRNGDCKAAQAIPHIKTFLAAAPDNEVSVVCGETATLLEASQ